MSVSTWISSHRGAWEFIKFAVLSNISTVFRFVFTWLGTAVFLDILHLTQPFSFLVFNYTDTGLGSFLTFLVAEVVAQVVNFFVQMKLVFRSEASVVSAAWKYAVLAVVIIVVNLLLPNYVTSFCTATLGLPAGAAATVASVVNTLLAVVVSFPVLKFWITPERS